MYSITRVSEDKISCDFLQVERGSTRSSRYSFGGLNKGLPKKLLISDGQRGQTIISRYRRPKKSM